MEELIMNELKISETDLVNQFAELWHTQHPDEIVDTHSGNDDSGMDVQIQSSQKIIGLEAKRFADNRNSSGNFYKMFGQILKGRKLFENESKKVEYGFLFLFCDKERVLCYLKTINYFDLITFFTAFDIKHFYFYRCNDGIKNYYDEIIKTLSQKQFGE